MTKHQVSIWTETPACASSTAIVVAVDDKKDKEKSEKSRYRRLLAYAK